MTLGSTAMKYITVQEASKKLGLTDRQVRNLCVSGKIKESTKVGKSWIIPENFNIEENKKEKSLNEKLKENRELYNLKYNYIIIHGTFGHPGENWFPWLAEQISKLDRSGNTQKEDILIPHFPSSSCSDYDSWKSILMGYIDSGIINKNTIFICHSLGPLFVSRVLIEEKIRVKGMISVEAAANHIMGNPSFDNINKTFFVPSWEYLNRVKKYLDFNYCFYTDNDPHIPYNILREYVEHAATKTFFIPNAGHFNTASGYSTFPQLLELIKSIECNEAINENKIERLQAPSEIWSKELSHKWTNMTWPNRPSVGELSIYTDILRKSQKLYPSQKSCLILGSNVEFRDWAYEENLDVSIMQNNEEYHLATYRELRHKNAPYKIILRPWQEVDFQNKFDFIVGDQLIGNLGDVSLDDFLCRVSKSLKNNGYFLSKSYYRPKNYKSKSVNEIFNCFKQNSYLNPISVYGFDLTISSLSKNKKVNFTKMINLIENAYKKKLIDKTTYENLINIGLDKMDFEFHVPTIKEYSSIASKYFEIESILYSNDIGAENFPLYILKKKTNSN